MYRKYAFVALLVLAIIWTAVIIGVMIDETNRPDYPVPIENR